MRVLALTRHGAIGAGSRYRTLAYLPYLRSNGFTVDVAPLVGDEYIEKRYSGRVPSPFRLLQNYARRIFQLLRTRKYDLLWIEKETLPWMPYWMEAALLKFNVKYVVDYDDAVFHRYDDHQYAFARLAFGKKIGSLMRNSAMVIAGNDYIADYANRAGAPLIRQLPSVVDLTKYPLSTPRQNPRLNIGWIGTPITARLLGTIQPALQQICRDNSAQVIAIGAGNNFTLPDVPLTVRPWSSETEVDELHQIDVGIMPLSDTVFERGKCGLKLIQYMACGKPVVGTPVGVNQKLIAQDQNGYQATTVDEWVHALKRLRYSPDDRARMGQEGRAMVAANYSLQVAAPKLAGFLKEAVETDIRSAAGRAA